MFSATVNIRGILLRIPIIRIIVVWWLHWVPAILGNYQVGLGNVGFRAQGLVLKFPGLVLNLLCLVFVLQGLKFKV